MLNKSWQFGKEKKNPIRQHILQYTFDYLYPDSKRKYLNHPTIYPCPNFIKGGRELFGFWVNGC